MNIININHITIEKLDNIYIAADENNNLLHICLGEYARQNLASWIWKNYPKAVVNQKEDLAPDLLIQIDSYINKGLQHITFPYKLHMTSFQEKVLNTISEIPYGQTITYSELAKKIGKPGAARAIGGACNKNPFPLLIPCHRVVGTSSIGGFGPGIEYKKRLLLLEKMNRETLLR